MQPYSDDGCAHPPSPTLLAAVRQFNAGAYFTCHETLEELWFVETIPLRAFYQGLLHVAVGLNHLRRGNERGAASLLTSGCRLLHPFLPVCLAIDVAALLPDVERVLAMLAEQGPERARAMVEQSPPQILLTGGCIRQAAAAAPDP